MSEENKNPVSSGQSEKTENTSPKRKSRLRRIFPMLAVILLVWWYNNYTIKTPYIELKSDKIQSSFRIAVISDLHASHYGIGNDTIIEKINKSEPDIIFILGDMYSRKSEWELIEIPIELTQSLTDAGYPVYFIPGDHDTSQNYINQIAETGAHVMDYKGEIININGNNVQILGIDNVYYSATFDLNNAFSLAENCYTILMAHIPNYEKFADFGADLTICGDTHGGIIQLPFGKGPAYYSETDSWFPEINGKRSDIYDKGLFPYDNGTMLITSGIGAYPVPLRFNNRPEIVIVDIESSDNK